MSNTGSPYLDNFLSYGSMIHCIYGKPSTGKTNICLTATAQFAKDKKVIFIDTENSFSIDRIRQISSEIRLNNILLFKAKSFDEQCLIINKILEMKEEIGLVIVDSLSMHYRKALQQKENPNPLLSKQLSILSEIARKGVPIIISCQVYSKQDGSISPVGGEMIKNWSPCIIKLGNEQERTLSLDKHPKIKEFNIPFTIIDKGISH